MEQLTEIKAPFWYSLMDNSYECKAFDGFITERGRIPIIDPNKQKDNQRPPLDLAKQKRYPYAQRWNRLSY
jgi:hypothetical protein